MGRVRLARNMQPDSGTNAAIPARLLKVALKAGDYMTECLGADCRIKFLPLCVRSDGASGSGADEDGEQQVLARGHNGNQAKDDGGPLWMRRPGDAGPKAVGLVLVGRRSLSKAVPRTRWHKWGMYWSSEYEETRLENWEEGISVGALDGSEADVADATWSGWLSRTMQGWVVGGGGAGNGGGSNDVVARQRLP